MPRKRLPIVAIVGRPNTGKSTLFNRIVGKRIALVHEMPGMTRDRHYARADHEGKPFILIDTGGYEESTESPLLALMRQQTLVAIDQADAIVFLAESDVFNHPIDREVLQRLRAGGKPYFLAVNKADNPKLEMQAYADFAAYGVDQVYPVSALHGPGVYELLNDVTAPFPERDLEAEDAEGGPIRVAIVGRQNVGKSTLVNRLLGEERMVASDVPGTTHDAIDTDMIVDGQEYTLIDTAGIRRRGKVEHGAEWLSVMSSFAAIDRCDVALLLLDATQGPTAQDTHIGGYVLERGKACIIVLNKWDAVPNREDYGKHINKVREDFKYLRWAPILTISAKTGQRAYKLWGLIAEAAENYRAQVSTAQLNKVLKMALAHISPPVTRNRGLRIKYVTQVATAPPTFAFFVNDPELVHFSYERYLQNQYRRELGLEGTPIRFSWRRKAIERGWDPKVREEARSGGPRRDYPKPRLGPQFIQVSDDEMEVEYEAGYYDEEQEL